MHIQYNILHCMCVIIVNSWTTVLQGDLANCYKQVLMLTVRSVRNIYSKIEHECHSQEISSFNFKSCSIWNHAQFNTNIHSKFWCPARKKIIFPPVLTVYSIWRTIHFQIKTQLSYTKQQIPTLQHFHQNSHLHPEAQFDAYQQV